MKKLAEIAASHGVALGDAALQFCLAHPVVASVIPGARTAAEVQSHWQMVKAKIPSAFWDDLREPGLAASRCAGRPASGLLRRNERLEEKSTAHQHFWRLMRGDYSWLTRS